jgi:hypothetical protein
MPAGARIRPGDPAGAALASENWNYMMEGAELAHAKPPARGARPSQPEVDRCVILVQNNTGTDLGRFAVVGLYGVPIEPTYSGGEDEFLYCLAVSGRVPTEDDYGRFAILQEPLAAGEIGHACLWGITHARVRINDATDRYADIWPSQTAWLDSQPGGGTAQILWCEDDEGDNKLALVRIAKPSLVGYGLAQSDWAENSGNPRVSVIRCDADGSGERGNAFYVYLPRTGDQDPAVFDGDVVPFTVDEQGRCVGHGSYLSLKIGSVIIWNAAAVDIPTGWRECNYTATLDMRGCVPLGLHDNTGPADEQVANAIVGTSTLDLSKRGVTEGTDFDAVDDVEDGVAHGEALDRDNRQKSRVVRFIERYK